MLIRSVVFGLNDQSINNKNENDTNVNKLRKDIQLYYFHESLKLQLRFVHSVQIKLTASLFQGFYLYSRYKKASLSWSIS